MVRGPGHGRSAARVRRLLPPLLLLGMLLARPAPAGEEQAVTGPGERATAARAAFPAPSAASAGFEVACYVLRGGAPYARARLSAWPSRRTDPDGPDTWQVRDVIHPLDGTADRLVVHAHLDGQLALLHGVHDQRNARGFLKATWQRAADDGAYDIEHVTDDYENRLRIEGPPATGTLAGLLLFLRLVPLAPGVLEVPDLDPNPGGGDGYLETARIEVHGRAPWRLGTAVRDAWVVSVTRGLQTLRLALDPATRDFLGLEVVGRDLAFVPAGHGGVGLAEGTAAELATPWERALKRTRALRTRLPVPARAWTWEGDLREGGAIVGSVRVEAEPAALGGRPAWRVLEAAVLRTGASEVRTETSGFLAQDLSLLRGEDVDARPEGISRASYVRAPGGMETVRSAGEATEDPVLLGAAPDAIAGLVPVLLLLRDVPAEASDYVLPGFDPRFAGPPKAGTGTLPGGAADVHVQVRPGAAFAAAPGASRESLAARCSLRTGLVFVVHVDPVERTLLGVEGVMPSLSWAPRGLAAAPLDWYDAVEGAPRSARQAFVKFGRGYHLPREDLLADALHWPSLHERALRTGRYPAGTPLERVKQDWIDVFVGMSKHRTKADCDDLLFQIFMTSREVAGDDGSVRLTTRPAYGGHTYTLRELDGRWWITQID